jgi:ribosome-associated toxin RatA of RatAB toxin-antitoxin module
VETLWEHRVEHAIEVAAAPEVVYHLVRDVTNWPVIFGPTVHVQHLEQGADAERFRIWAIANGEVMTWISRRTFDSRALVIGFAQERSQAPIASMAGEWTFRPTAGGGTEVVLGHQFTAVDADADTLRWIEQALDRNSGAELAGLRRIAELDPPLSEIYFSFDDTVEIDGSAVDAYQFVYEAAEWPIRLPHVQRVSVTEDEPGIQRMEMDTATADGSTHTTNSVRICFPDELIVYKQVVAPALLLGHSGRWTFRQTETGVSVTATHTVAIKPDAVKAVLGATATLDEAKVFAREALGSNSRTTLAHAKAFAEARRAGRSAEGSLA